VRGRTFFDSSNGSYDNPPTNQLPCECLKRNSRAPVRTREA
jgi:hypothetical protein